MPPPQVVAETFHSSRVALAAMIKTTTWKRKVVEANAVAERRGEDA